MTDEDLSNEAIEDTEEGKPGLVTDDDPLEDDPATDHEPTTVTIGTSTGTVEVTVTEDPGV